MYSFEIRCNLSDGPATYQSTIALLTHLHTCNVVTASGHYDMAIHCFPGFGLVSYSPFPRFDWLIRRVYIIYRTLSEFLFDEQVECPNNRTPLGFWHLLSLMTLKLSEALKWTSGWTKRYLGNKWQVVYYLSTKYKYVLKSLIGFRQIKPISVGWVSNWYLPAIFPLFVAWISLWIKATQPE